MAKKKNRFDHTYDDSKRFHGCDLNYFNFTIDTTLLNELRKILIKQSERTISSPRKITGIKLATDFLTSHFELHDVDVLPTDKSAILNRVLNDFDSEVQKDTYYSLLEQISPLDLKCEFVESLGNFTYAVFPVKGEKPYFDKISLSNLVENTKLTETNYIHEIIHTQLDSVESSFKNIYNSELLPFLCELIYSYEVTSKDNGELLRYTIKEMFDIAVDKAKRIYDEHKYTYDVDRNYFSSIFKAFYLFDLYQKYDDDNDRYSMLDFIQNIFDGKNSVEDLLVKYNFAESEILNDSVVKMLKK